MPSDIEVDLSQLLTPASRCISLKLGPIDCSVVDLLDDNDYEFAPVLNEDAGAVGLIGSSRARELFNQGRSLTNGDTDREGVCVARKCSLEALLATLSSRVAVLVTPASPEPTGTRCSDWLGLVTIYDLNRHYFRALLYGLLAELEVRLAKIIETKWREPWDWIAALTDDEQARVIGYWKLAEHRHADIGPTAACMLTQLLKIIETDKVTLSQLGFCSRAEFKRKTGGIPDLRNQIMHPVRPMIFTPTDVHKLGERTETIHNLNLRLAKLQTW